MLAAEPLADLIACWPEAGRLADHRASRAVVGTSFKAKAPVSYTSACCTGEFAGNSYDTNRRGDAGSLDQLVSFSPCAPQRLFDKVVRSRSVLPCRSFSGLENFGGVAPAGHRLRIFSWVPGIASQH